MAIAAIVTASDGVAAGQRDDRSGRALRDRLERAGFAVTGPHVVPDDRDRIATSLRRLADDDDACDLVVVTGGTGFGPRDVTPEATADVIDRPAPGLAEAMRAAGRAVTPLADLSRAVAGVRGRTLIVDVPGSPKGALESLESIIDLLPHALDLLAGDTTSHPVPTSVSAADVEDVRPADGHAGHDHRPHVDRAHDHADQHDRERPAHGNDEAAHDNRRDHGHDDGHDHGQDPACDLAHGHGQVDRDWRLVAISASPVALWLLHWGRELGYTTVLVEPDPTRVSDDHRRHADRIVTDVANARLDDTCDVVATDHDVAGLVDHLAAALSTPARWLGLMGSARHTPPHIDGLRARGFDEEAIARIHRPIGLDIGSHTPPEIALSTLAGLIADRNGR